MSDDDHHDVVDSSEVRIAECSTRHIVSVCTAPIKDGGTVPRVDVYITFTGKYEDCL